MSVNKHLNEYFRRSRKNFLKSRHRHRIRRERFRKEQHKIDMIKKDRRDKIHKFEEKKTFRISKPERFDLGNAVSFDEINRELKVISRHEFYDKFYHIENRIRTDVYTEKTNDEVYKLIKSIEKYCFTCSKPDYTGNVKYGFYWCNMYSLTDSIYYVDYNIMCGKEHHLRVCDPTFHKVLTMKTLEITPENCNQCKTKTPVSHRGSQYCIMQTSIASGGTEYHCTCNACY